MTKGELRRNAKGRLYKDGWKGYGWIVQEETARMIMEKERDG